MKTKENYARIWGGGLYSSRVPRKIGLGLRPAFDLAFYFFLFFPPPEPTQGETTFFN